MHDDLLNCATYSLGIVGTIKDLLFMINRKLFSVLEARLVETVQVGEMDSQPHQAAFTERFFDTKRQQTSSEIITDRVQMRRNRVGSTTEIEVMWDVKDVVEVLWEIGVSSVPDNRTPTIDSQIAQSPNYS